MKLYLFILIFAFTSISALAQNDNHFSSTRVSIGEIIHKDTARVKIIYTNKSSEMRLILNATTNCDCTWLDYPKSPIAPNATAEITIVYNAKSKGVFMKNIDILMSNRKKQRISVIGTVVAEK